MQAGLHGGELSLIPIEQLIQIEDVVKGRTQHNLNNGSGS